MRNVMKLRDWLQTNAQEWAILVDVVQDPADLLELCESQGLSIVSHVVSILDPFIAYPWGAARHPLLLSRTARGWVNAAFVQDNVMKNSPSKGLQEHRELGALLLREMTSSRGGEQVSMRPLTGDIIQGALAQSCSSPFARFLSRPYQGMSSPHRELFQPQARLWKHFVPSQNLVLDFEILQKLCMECLHQAAEEFILPPEGSFHGHSVWHGLFCVEAKARGVTSGISFWAQASPDLRKAAMEMETSPAKGMVLTPKGELRPPQHWQEPLASALGVVFWWCLPSQAMPAINEKASAAVAEVARCVLQPPVEDTAWDINAVPPGLRAEIEEEVRLEGPPDGYYFDGVRYINQEDCAVSMEHPNFMSRLSCVVQNHNDEQMARRRLIQEVMEMPLFSTSRQPPSPVRPPGHGKRPMRGYKGAPA
ncbi:unnamed protein product [Symbiodinium pilosum]|uniref:Uncharacterized protein n=1 Tax=Symbiodinium pilosum TaxID=2952 RepID=A0A812WC93_SYMPI|nr:unnamed protein product [Symbiodinium pilosum]